VSPVPRPTLAEQISRAVDPAALRDITLWRQASGELMKSIPPGAWAAISEASKVILIPDDVLWRVPFEALPVGNAFLADRTTVLYAGSASSLLQWPSTAPEWPKSMMLAVSAPEISSSTRDRLQATTPGWTLRSSDGAAAEIEAIAAVFDDPPTTVLSGTAATESAFRESVERATIIHIAAPFRMNGASPLFSSILLTSETEAGEPVPDKDGVLEARDVMNLEPRPHLTVFTDGSSASMRGAASAADIVSWAWRAAGSPSIVLPRWDTDIRARATFLKAMYTNTVMLGSSVEGGAREAMAVLRVDEATRAPYYWAGWQVIGR